MNYDNVSLSVQNKWKDEPIILYSKEISYFSVIQNSNKTNNLVSLTPPPLKLLDLKVNNKNQPHQNLRVSLFNKNDRTWQFKKKYISHQIMKL
jgi:hypothetical protein